MFRERSEGHLARKENRNSPKPSRLRAALRRIVDVYLSGWLAGLPFDVGRATGWSAFGDFGADVVLMLPFVIPK